MSISEESAFGLTLIDRDIAFSNGQLSTVKGIEFTAQNINERIDTRLGELYFNKHDGIDRHSLIHNQNLDEVANIFKKIISSTHTVNKILSFDIQKDNQTRITYITYSVSTIFGDNIEGEYSA
jgi:hypothetical protein